MKRRTTTAAAVSAAACSAVALESLELRRMLSSYSVANTLTDTDGGQAYADFGRGVATQGTLALIGSPGQTASVTFDGGQTFEQIDTTAGKVSLVDTLTGTILHTFHNPIANPGTGQNFGAAVAFVDGKIAISAPGAVSVYIYNDIADDLPDQTYTFGGDPFVSYGGTMAVDGNDLLVSCLQADPGNNNGAILRYDVSSASSDPVAEYFNPATNGASNDQFGAVLASDGTYIYAKANDNGNSNVIALDNNGNLVHVYHGPSGDSLFGIALATAGNNTLMISAPAANAVNQVDINGNVVQTFNLPTQDQIFGTTAWSLAVNGDKLIAGNNSKLTPGFDSQNQATVTPTGAAYVFDIPSGQLDYTIENPNQGTFFSSDLNDYYDDFGLAVAGLPDGNFLISAPTANNDNGIDAGTVFVYAPDIAPPTNIAPTAEPISGQGDGVRQQSLAFSGSFTDPDVGDTHDVSWDFGDGNVIAFHPTTDAGALSVSHVYTATGAYTVTMTVKDAAGASDDSTFNVNVTATGLQGSTLYAGGTSGNDVIDVNRASNGRIKVRVNGSAFEFFTASHIVLLGGAGNDDMSVGTGITIDADLFGGEGADTLLGGGGSDFLDGGSGNDDVKARGGTDIGLGGSGDDLVTGGEGRDFLIGGTGADKVTGNADDDILVAGTTSYDGNRAALSAIQAEWLSTHTYAQRIANIRNGSGTPTRANGNNFLAADSTVFDDNAKDTLTGGAGSDWFLGNTDSGIKDKINDQNGEVSDDVDVIV